MPAPHKGLRPWSASRTGLRRFSQSGQAPTPAGPRSARTPSQARAPPAHLPEPATCFASPLRTGGVATSGTEPCRSRIEAHYRSAPNSRQSQRSRLSSARRTVTGPPKQQLNEVVWAFCRWVRGRSAGQCDERQASCSAIQGVAETAGQAGHCCQLMQWPSRREMSSIGRPESQQQWHEAVPDLTPRSGHDVRQLSGAGEAWHGMLLHRPGLSSRKR